MAPRLAILLSLILTAINTNASKVYVDSPVAFNRVEGIVMIDASWGTPITVALYREFSADSGSTPLKIASVGLDGHFEFGPIPAGKYTVYLRVANEARHRFPLVIYKDKRPLSSWILIQGSPGVGGAMDYNESVTTRIPNKYLPD